MDKQDILEFAKKAIPWIGAAASGNVPALVTMAAKAVGDAVGNDVAATGEAIAAAVSGATPEQLLALKTADADFALKMQALNFSTTVELERVAAGDRDSARKMQIETKDWTPRAIALVVVLAWMVVSGILLFMVIAPEMKELVARLLGTLDAALMLVLTYFFGSTSGSSRKTELLASKKT